MQPNITSKYYGAAAQYNKKNDSPGGRLLKIGLLILLIIVVFSGGAIAFSALTSGGKNDAARLVARERQLILFLNNNQKTIASDDFQTANANALSLATSDYYALQQGLSTAYGLTTVPDAIAKEEIDTTSVASLRDAEIQSRFDTVYLKLLRDKVTNTEGLARTVLSSSSGKFRTAIQTQLNNLTAIDNQLAKLQL